MSSRSIPAQVKAEICRRYASGESAPALSSELGVDKTSLYRFLKEGGVPVRQRRRPSAECHPERPHFGLGKCHPCYARENHLQRVHGLSVEDFDAMLNEQDGRCAICRRKQHKQQLSVDHDHVTRRIRGLLCTRCNRGLGSFEWGMAPMQNLLVYASAIVKERQTFDQSLD